MYDLSYNIGKYLTSSLGQGGTHTKITTSLKMYTDLDFYFNETFKPYIELSLKISKYHKCYICSNVYCIKLNLSLYDTLMLTIFQFIS